MSEEKKYKCPFSNGDFWVDCIKGDCLGWREIDHGDFDCMLIRGKKA